MRFSIISDSEDLWWEVHDAGIASFDKCVARCDNEQWAQRIAAALNENAKLREWIKRYHHGTHFPLMEECVNQAITEWDKES